MPHSQERFHVIAENSSSEVWADTVDRFRPKGTWLPNSCAVASSKTADSSRCPDRHASSPNDLPVGKFPAVSSNNKRTKSSPIAATRTSIPFQTNVLLTMGRYCNFGCAPPKPNEYIKIRVAHDGRQIGLGQRIFAYGLH